MKANTVITSSGAEVYANSISEYADEFISLELDNRDEDVHDNFQALIFYLSDRIEHPDNGDVDALDAMFDAYVRLCVKYGVLPTIEMFAILVKINRATFTDWKNREYRTLAHSNTVKKWLSTCKALVIDRLHNQRGTDANLIFTAKAAYGMIEATPGSMVDSNNALSMDTPQQISQRRAGEKPDFPQEIE